MGVDDGLHIRAHPIDQQMHTDFTGNATASSNLFTVQANDDHVGRAHGAFAHACRGDQNPVTREADREISVHGGYKSPFVEHSTVADDFFPMFAFNRHGYPWGGDDKKQAASQALA